MKKIIFIFLPFTILLGCDKETEQEPENELSYEQRMMYERFDELGIKPSDKDSISYLGGFIDSTTYKLALGRKNGHAWVAKFNSSGDEIFSFEVKETHPDKKYSHYDQTSILFGDANTLFVRCWHTNYEEVSYFNAEVYSSLSMIDIQSGKELKRFDFVQGEGLYGIKKIADSYFVEGPYLDIHANPNLGNRSYQSFYMIKGDNVLWERKCADYEKSSGIDFYGNQVFLDYERIIYEYNSSRPYYDSEGYTQGYIESYYRVVNLKDRELLYEFDGENIPLFGKERGEEYVFENIEIKDDFMRIGYRRDRKVPISDPIAGVYDEKTETVGKYYYDIDINDYSVKSHVILKGEDAQIPSRIEFKPDKINAQRSDNVEIHLSVYPKEANLNNVVIYNTNFSTPDNIFTLNKIDEYNYSISCINPGSEFIYAETNNGTTLGECRVSIQH
jgi:hypothetical protein